MRSSIAVIGEKESVLGFKAVGFAVYETEGSAEVPELIETLRQQQVGIIFITEQTLAPIAGLLERYKDVPLPAIIPIPGRKGSMGLGLSNVKKSVERAVGADILFKD
ncbi:MAG: V-type ATP synthase subunit F [Angelakisella sp.]